jgi:hypothetical protein
MGAVVDPEIYCSLGDTFSFSAPQFELTEWFYLVSQ